MHPLADTRPIPASPLTLVTADCLDIGADLRPWLDRYRRCCLPPLASVLTLIRMRRRPPCVFVHAASEPGRSMLARAMVFESHGVQCLDCAASAYRCRDNLQLTAVSLDGCGVFVIDEIDYLSGAELTAFYRRCCRRGVILVLLSQNLASPHCIGFELPRGAAAFRLNDGERDAGEGCCLLPIDPRRAC